MKLKTFWNLLFLCCILSSPTILEAHNPAEFVCIANPIKICGQRNQLSPGQHGLCPTGTIPATFNSNCRDGYVELSAYTTNLVKAPQKGQTYSWPSKYPDLHLEWEYDSGVFVTSAKLNSWTYIGKVDGISVFECPLDVVPLILEANYQCQNIPTPEVHTMVVKIVTPAAGNGYDIYPIHNYNGPHDIFSCKVFTETCAACSLPTGVFCAALEEPIYDVDVCLDCTGCDSSESANNNTDKQSKAAPAAQISMQVQPNPFSSQTNLNYVTNQNGAVNISIYNAQGTQLSIKNEMSYTGKNSFDLNMANLPNGIYYIEVSDGVNVNLQRVVKMQ